MLMLNYLVKHSLKAKSELLTIARWRYLVRIWWIWWNQRVGSE